MKVFTDIHDIMTDAPAVVVLGKFDGVHKGHRALLQAAKAAAEEKKLKIAVFTFAIPFGYGTALTTTEERRHIFAEQRLDYLVECPFEAVQNMDAEAFMENIILGRLRAEFMVAGTDCRFGRNRSGDAGLACRMMEAHGGKAVIIDKVRYGVREISSSYIREELSKGNMAVVNRLLGYDYFFEGIVVGGNRIGRTLHFPTLNLVPDEKKALPPYGVYASQVLLEGREYAGVTNIGRKPTVGSQMPTVETFLFDYDADAYGKTLRVMLKAFIRPEKRFDSLEKLQNQIEKDICAVKNILA